MDPQNGKSRGADAPVTSWVARYGHAIRRDGIAAIPIALYHCQAELALTIQEVWFVSAVLAHKWDAAAPFPSLRKLAEHTGIELRRIQRIQASLRAKDYLTVQERFDTKTGRQEANSYDFTNLFARLETRLAAVPPEASPIHEGDEALTALPEEARDSSFVARFGRVIARAGVAAIPHGLFKHQAALGLNPQQVWFIGYILSFKWTTDVPHPSLVRMEQRTGYTRRNLQKIKDTLVAQQYLRLVPRRGVDGGQDTNGYDFSGLLDKLSTLLPQEEAPLPTPLPEPTALPRPAQRRRLAHPQERMTQSSQGRMIESTQGGTTENSQGGMANNSPGGMIARLQGRMILRSQQDGEQFTAESGSEFATGDATPFTQRRTDQEEPDQEENSNQHALKKKNRTKPKTAVVERAGECNDHPPYSPYIAQVVLDLSRELGDLNAVSNVTQALRLWQMSGLDEEAFVAALYDAKLTVRKAQAHGVGNKGAYWFKVIRDALDLN